MRAPILAHRERARCLFGPRSVLRSSDSTRCVPPAVSRNIELEPSPEEIQLIQAGLRLRLVAENDRIPIDGLRYLIARIDREIRAAAR